MKDHVSGWWTSGLALIASMSVVGAIFIPFGFPWGGLVWAIAALTTAFWVASTSRRAITQLVGDIDAQPPSTPFAEPLPTCAAPQPFGGPMATALNRRRTG
jgi:hypothetical protein